MDKWKVRERQYSELFNTDYIIGYGDFSGNHQTIAACHCKNEAEWIADLLNAPDPPFDVRGLVEELVKRPSLYLCDDHGMFTCKVCGSDYHRGYSPELRAQMNYPQNLPQLPGDHFCTNETCPAVKARAWLGAQDD